MKTVEMLHNVDRDHTVPYYNLKIIFFLVIPDFVFPCFSFIYPCSWGLENLSSGKKSLKSTLNFKVCPCNQTHQISGLISANNISLWVTFYLESEIPILAKIDLIRPYLSIGSRKNVQKSVFSWFKINNGTPKFLCCLVNHQEMSHNFVKLHFRDAPHPVSYEYMWWQKLYANRALLSPCHLIFNFLLKIASDSHQVQWVDSSKPRNDAKNLTLLNKSFNVIK